MQNIMDYFGKVLKLRFNLEFRRFQNNIKSENIQKNSEYPKIPKVPIQSDPNFLELELEQYI